MRLKENVWYIIDNEHDRNEFIYDLCCAMKITKTQLIAQYPEVQTAKVIKYKQKGSYTRIFDINYRTEFKPEYLQGPREHYEPTSNIRFKPFDLASYKDNSILTSNVIKEWVDARIADIERNKTELKPATLTINTACGQSGLSNHVDSWLETTKKLMIDKQQNTMTKIYEGDNNMICSNEYNEKYLIQQYFEKEEKKLTDEKIKERDEYLNNTAIYTSAKNFVNILNHNKSNPFTTVPTPLAMIKEYLSKDQMEALNKIDNKYNEEVEEVRKKCKVVESLINMCDNADQKMDILRRYEIIKLPKMPK